tara:strand:+ start:238 stop:567 length:330 start_codon:yes stop_codon:yes gene_type:complete
MNNEAFNNLTKSQQLYVESIRTIGGAQLGYDITKTNWTRKELVAVSLIRQNNDDVPNWIVKDHSRRVARGLYAIPELPISLQEDVYHSITDDLDDDITISDDMIVQEIL